VTTNTDIYREILSTALNSTGIPEAYKGPTWTTQQLVKQFEVIGFAAPFVRVRRREDEVAGTLMFVHSPRIYFRWEPDTEKGES
jgi:hypothetical protein